MMKRSVRPDSLAVLLPLFVQSLLTVAVCPAATYTVDATGGAQAATIQAGIGMAAAGDTVLVLPGVYAENVILKSGVALRSRDGFAHTTIDGGMGRCIEAQRCATGSRIVGFTLTSDGAYDGGGVRVFDHTEIEIAHNQFLDNRVDFSGAGIWVQRYSNASIHDNRFENTSSHLAAAIAVVVFSSADIRNNVFLNNESAAHGAAIGVHESHVVVVENLFLHNRSAGDSGTVDFYKATGKVYNNTFIGNSGSATGASALAIRDGVSRVSVARNIFAGQTGGPALLTETCQQISCNIFWQNELDYTGDCPQIDRDGNVRLDPLLISSRPGCLAADSPCLTFSCGPVGNLAVGGCE